MLMLVFAMAATFSSFKADKSVVNPEEAITLTWITNHSLKRVTLNDGTNKIECLLNGSTTVNPYSKTVCTLKAIDDQGNVTDTLIINDENGVEEERSDILITVN
ncbi:hypothetical protein [Pseudobacteroides cellulosolvens]|uniref:Uncharacterized protein n=1 Tax=Pseudobacteroides cellulosolvens ATCC 35603 = DSM 2933 TaxID=398512 RepID=A0A0L6JIJ4_9FIRM|nr:hypothetical protein [Pseudobacteroides cellulosolvens]KNY25550.1 hypothetical protein Bccel_0810 [Pseudobacteroides cellulosolvens ATCC 35603 = DSM 2933]